MLRHPPFIGAVVCGSGGAQIMECQDTEKKYADYWEYADVYCLIGKYI
jgi:hypothetical protein